MREEQSFGDDALSFPSYSMEDCPPYRPAPQSGYVPLNRHDDSEADLGLLRYLVTPPTYVPIPNPITASREVATSPDAIDALSDLRLGFAYDSKALLQNLLDDRETLRLRERSEIWERITGLSAEIGAAGSLNYGLSGDKHTLDLGREKWQLEQELVNADLRSWRDRLGIQERLLQSENQYQKTKLQTDLLGDLTG
jgi:hypothetical protein